MTPTEKLLKLANSLTWQDIASLTHNEYVLLYSDKGFFEPNDKYQIGTREQWHLTATHWMQIPDGKAGEVIRILVEGLQHVQQFGGCMLTTNPPQNQGEFTAKQTLQRASEAMGGNDASR
jgi:hypothetical protein